MDTQVPHPIEQRTQQTLCRKKSPNQTPQLSSALLRAHSGGEQCPLSGQPVAGPAGAVFRGVALERFFEEQSVKGLMRFGFLHLHLQSPSWADMRR